MLKKEGEFAEAGGKGHEESVGTTNLEKEIGTRLRKAGRRRLSAGNDVNKPVCSNDICAQGPLQTYRA